MKKLNRPSSLEILEDRIAPAGVVTVTTNAAGEFVIDGDNADNQFSVFQTAPNTFRIEGLTGTTLTVDGTAGLLSFDFTKLTKITASGNGGNDVFNLSNVSTLKSLAYDGGAGDDSLTAVNAGVKGNVDLSGGTGVDDFSFDGLTANISGNLKVTDGGGLLKLNLFAEKSVIGGSLTVVGSTGSEAITTTGGTLSIGKGVNLDAGTTLPLAFSLGHSGRTTIGKLATGESILATGEGGTLVAMSLGDFTLAGGVKVTGGSTTPDGLQINPSTHNVKIGKLSTGQSILMEAGGGGGIFGMGLSVNAVTATFAGGIEYSNSGMETAMFLGNPNGRITIGKLPTGHSIKYTGSADSDKLITDVSSLVLSGGVEFIGGGGSNSISLNSVSGSTKIGKLPSGASLQYTGGSGTDSATLNVANLTLAGGIDFTGGDGSNSLTENAPNGTAKIGKLAAGGGSIKYVGGADTDSVTTANLLLNLAGGIDFAGGVGSNSINLTGPNGKLNVGKLSTGQSVKYVGGIDTDSLTTNFASAIFAGSFEIAADDGSNAFSFIGTGGLLSIGKLATGQSVIYTGGAGSDDFGSPQAVVTVAGGIDFTPGNGANRLAFDNNGRVTLGTMGTGQSVKYTGGNDADAMFIGGNVLLKGAIEMNGDNGVNMVDFDGISVVIGRNAAGESIKLTGGTGADRIDAEDSLVLAGSIVLEGNADVDVLDLTGLDQLKVGGGILFNGGADNDVFNINTFLLNVTRTIEYNGGDGTDDFVMIADGTLGGDLSIDLGNATTDDQAVTINSRNGLVPGLLVKGKLTVNSTGSAGSTDTVSISNLSVLDEINSSLGADVSVVTIDNLLANDLFNLDTGAGADFVFIEVDNLFGNSVFTKLAAIQTGAGVDAINIGNSIPTPTADFPDSTRARFVVGLNLDGGADTDTTNNILDENDFVPGAASFVTTNIP